MKKERKKVFNLKKNIYFVQTCPFSISRDKKVNKCFFFLLKLILFPQIKSFSSPLELTNRFIVLSREKLN
jgi:hypothetical protein